MRVRAFNSAVFGVIFAGLLTLTAAAGYPAVAAAQETATPTEQLRPVLDQLISILADESLRGKENKKVRRSLIMEAICDGFDFREMSKRVLGATWNTISVEEQDYFVSQMSKLLENVYIGKLEGYSGQTLEYVGERVRGGRAQVTTLVENEGVKLPVHYIMQLEDGVWMVYDINIEGVSLIRNYMEQFRSIIRQEQYAGLIKTIEEKNRFFAEEDGQ